MLLPYPLFFDRLDETANAYSRAHSGPPSQLLKEDNTTASAVKSSQQHDRLQLVLKDLELLEVGLFGGFMNL